VLAIGIYLPGSRYRDDLARRGFFHELAERVRLMPAVETAALGDAMPLQGFRMTAKVGDLPEVAIAAVGPGYLRTLGVSLMAGRDFTPEDRAQAPAVAIVSASLARAVFPGLDPLGQKVQLPGVLEQVAIVGVAHDVVQLRLDVPPKPQVYRPLWQWGSPSFLFVRSSGNPSALVDPIRRAVREIDPDQPLSYVTTMDQELADSLAPRRLNAVLIGLFASVALGLAALGLYGVIAQYVTQRTYEIGVRIALGAHERDVVWVVVRQAMGLVGVGTVLGLGLAVAITRLIRTLLYQVSPTDPLTFVAVTVLLTAVAGIVGWLPARRAARVDPVLTLRYE
jgi:predicted permease